MLSCGRGDQDHPEGCLVDAFNIIYYVLGEENYNAFNDTFTWVPYDLSIHAENCPFEDPTKLPAIVKNITDNLGLLPQFGLYNIPMIYYVK